MADRFYRELPGEPLTEDHPLVELLRAWMAMNSRSPLDGTISCKRCAALVLEDNADRHAAWHKRFGEIF